MAQTVTEKRTGNQNESAVISSNSNYTTQYIYCAGILGCGITSATLFTDSTTTLIVFVYPDNYSAAYRALAAHRTNTESLRGKIAP